MQNGLRFAKPHKKSYLTEINTCPKHLDYVCKWNKQIVALPTPLHVAMTRRIRQRYETHHAKVSKN